LPSLIGAFQATVTEASPGVALTERGAPGALPGNAGDDKPEIAPVPHALLAVTLKAYCVSGSSSVNVAWVAPVVV
jgi:hypothetical protein